MNMNSPTDRNRSRISRKRSRSPYRHGESPSLKHRRSRSPHRSSVPHDQATATAAGLPFGRSLLLKHDFRAFSSLFTEYLDVQKRLLIEDLDDHEVKGRWKSFMGKWNRGELAEGWYDPETERKAKTRQVTRRREYSQDSGHGQSVDPGLQATKQSHMDPEEEERYGPALPESARRRLGPAVPNLQDLQHRSELAEEERNAHAADLRHERTRARQLQKERLDELVPRADPGSRERQLEKKREAAAANRTFREAKSPAAEEVGDGDLIGEDGTDGYKAKMKAREKLKNEREVRKEEILRARALEREERMAEHRRKEEKTMEMLTQIAKQRFG